MIDYGGGVTNVDLKTGIRYGVISQHSVGEAWYEQSEPDYGEAHCPECGQEIFDSSLYSSGERGNEKDGELADQDYYCENCCKESFWSDEVFGEPISWFFEDDEYYLVSCLDSDIMVIRSPYYTYAAPCSPCVPGAGDLDSPREDGVKTYCLDSEWFDDDAPYPIFEVSEE
jgi:hypothetical protein